MTSIEVPAVENGSASTSAENRASELAWKTLAQSGCGALVADREGSIVYVNPRLCEISGYASEELLGKNPRILQSGRTPRETYQRMWSTISSGRTWRGALQNRKKNGEFYWETVTISPLSDGEGAITHYAAILEDITDQKTLEDAQTELNEEIFLEEKRESLTAMALGMAHVLNNSLSCILTACELAKSSEKNPQRLSNMLDQITAAAKQSAAFVGQIASLWKPAAAPFRSVDLVKLVSDHLAEYREATGRTPIRWKPGEEELMFTGDPVLVHQAILALVKNGAEASTGRSIELRCELIPRLEPGGEEFFIPCGLTGLAVVAFEVRDQGVGMDRYTLRRAFNPFYSTKSGRRGLGLSTVVGIMCAHRGAIGVTSSKEDGTSIRLYFAAQIS